MKVWSEQNANCVVTASGDGVLQLWDIDSNSNTPKCCYAEHTKEVYSIDWNNTRHEQLMLSASWDCSIKLWDPMRKHSLMTYMGHSQLVYNAKFSVHMANTFASVSGDGYLNLWNTMNPNPVARIKAHDAEVCLFYSFLFYLFLIVNCSRFFRAIGANSMRIF